MSCRRFNTCVIDSNGVNIGEELPAYRAGTEWWLAKYGESGPLITDTLTGSWLTSINNEMLAQHLRGTDAFDTCIRDLWDEPNVHRVIAAPTTVPTAP